MPMRRLRAPASTRPPAPATTTPTTTPSPTPTSRRIELIIKLGGSCLTLKHTPHTLHPTLFPLAIATIARLYSRNVGFILVHGAGSFGHFEAHKYAISAGTATPLGVSETHSAVTKLNTFIVDALIEHNVPAVGVAPLLVPAKTRADFIAALLDRGHVPVLHGDACYAGDGRTAILSGDALVASLIHTFQLVTRAVFLTDVPGVLHKPPEQLEDDLESSLVERICVSEQGQVNLNNQVETKCLSHDVTGGIVGKVAAAAKCVQAGGGRVVGFIAGVGTDAAEIVLGGGSEPWSRVECTRVVFEG